MRALAPEGLVPHLSNKVKEHPLADHCASGGFAPPLPRHQLKHRIAPRNLNKTLRRRTRSHWKVPLHFTPKVIQIQLQNLQLLRVRHRPQKKFQPHASLLQSDFTRSLGIAHPLRAPARLHKKAFALPFQQIDRSCVELPALSPAHQQQIFVGKWNADPDQKSKNTIKDLLDRSRLAKNRQAGIHLPIVQSRFCPRPTPPSQTAAKPNSCNTAAL